MSKAKAKPAPKVATTATKGHLTYARGPQIVPMPPNGLFSSVDENGTAITWNNIETRAQLARWAHQSAQHEKYVHFFLHGDADHYGMAIRDQVAGLPVQPGSTAEAALARGTANVRFINVSGKGHHLPELALDANGTPLDSNPQPGKPAKAWAWQGPNAEGVPNINLENGIIGYDEAFNYNLNKGAGA